MYFRGRMYFSFPSAVILLLASLVLSKAINQSPLHIAASNDGQSVLVHTRRQGSFQGNRLQHVDEVGPPLDVPTLALSVSSSLPFLTQRNQSGTIGSPGPCL